MLRDRCIHNPAVIGQELEDYQSTMDCHSIDKYGMKEDIPQLRELIKMSGRKIFQ